MSFHRARRASLARFHKTSHDFNLKRVRSFVRLFGGGGGETRGASVSMNTILGWSSQDFRNTGELVVMGAAPRPTFSQLRLSMFRCLRRGDEASVSMNTIWLCLHRVSETQVSCRHGRSPSRNTGLSLAFDSLSLVLRRHGSVRPRLIVNDLVMSSRRCQRQSDDVSSSASLLANRSDRPFRLAHQIERTVLHSGGLERGKSENI